MVARSAVRSPTSTRAGGQDDVSFTNSLKLFGVNRITLGGVGDGDVICLSAAGQAQAGLAGPGRLAEEV